MVTRTDASVLVVGGGAAGLQAAVMAARAGAQVTLVNDGQPGKSGNSVYLERLGETTLLVGGLDAEGAERHRQDLLRMGDGLGDPDLVRLYTEKCPEELAELARMGLVEPIDPQARTNLAGIQINVRVPHGFADGLLKALKEEAVARGVRIMAGYSLKQILPAGDGGWARFADRSAAELLISYRSLVMATGGLGGLYSLTTNPRTLRGSALAVFLQAGGLTTNLECIQYLSAVRKPCKGFFLPARFLTVGSIVCTDCGHTVRTPDSWPDRSLLMFRDLCIDMADHGCGGSFRLDLPKPEAFRASMPYTYRMFAKAGGPIETTPIEIGVCGHHLVGGIVVDRQARTSIRGIFAAGEIAGGLQGADRLSGSGIMEGLVLGRLAGVEAANWAAGTGAVPALQIAPGSAGAGRGGAQMGAWRRELTRRMDQVLVFKEQSSLARAQDTVRGIRLEAEDPAGGNWSVALEAAAAEAILTASLWRKETRGTFRRRDYAGADPKFHRPSFMAWDKDRNEPVVVDRANRPTWA